MWHAQRSYYEALLRAGVRIYLYKSPYILHSKHFTIDDDVAVNGYETVSAAQTAIDQAKALAEKRSSAPYGKAKLP